jgi:hypothetical protein
MYPLTLTKSTLSGMQQNVPFKDLPRTFKHAVQVALSLGILYIWIDSLCIIQDDASDWELESAKMASIYAHSYLNLAAIDSPNSHGGFLPEETCNRYLKIPRKQPKPYNVYVRPAIRLPHLAVRRVRHHRSLVSKNKVIYKRTLAHYILAIPRLVLARKFAF